MNRAILVKSCQKNHDRRVACTLWLDTLWAEGIAACFVVGGHTTVATNQGMLALNCGDEYQDNSFKLKLALQQLLAISSFTHLFICDDDTFVHPKRWLEHEPEEEFECQLIRPNSGGDGWANGGAGWWMSRRMCELYVHDVTKRCSWDDKLASEVAEANGIRIVDRPDLYGDSRYANSERVSAENTLITCHPVGPEEMLTLWEATQELVT